jgi:ABC-2 type transport system permease protein
MTFIDVISHEWKTRLSSPATLAALLIYASALLYGTSCGRMQRDAHLQVIAEHQADVSARMQEWLEAARALEQPGSSASVPAWAASPMDVTFASYLRPAPLADFAIGQSDLLPYVGAVSLWDPDIRLFSRYEFEDPVAVAFGKLDLSKAIVLVLPLLLIVLCFDVLSAERDANRLAFSVAQGARIRSLTWQRLTIRGSLAAAVTFVIAVLALLLHGGTSSLAERMPYFALWACAVLLYCVFWLALIAFVVSRNRRSDANIILLLLAWTAFTLILPASVVAIAEMVFPAPSRPAYLAEAREMEIQTELEDEVAQRFALDHPDMMIDAASEVPAYFRSSYLAMSAVDAATRPTLLAFEKTAAERDEALNILRYVSPAITIYGLFNDVAGASSARHRHYMSQARAFKAAYAERAGLYVISGRRLPLAEVDTLPSFRFDDESSRAVVNRSLGGLLFLMLMSVALLIVSDRRLRRAGVLVD